jgi:hypothetical protein
MTETKRVSLSSYCALAADRILKKCESAYDEESSKIPDNEFTFRYQQMIVEAMILTLFLATIEQLPEDDRIQFLRDMKRRMDDCFFIARGFEDVQKIIEQKEIMDGTDG